MSTRRNYYRAAALYVHLTKFFAVLLIAVAFIMAIQLPSGVPQGGDRTIPIMIFGGCLLSGFGLLVSAQMMAAVIDTAINTAETCEAVQELIRLLAPMESDSVPAAPSRHK